MKSFLVYKIICARCSSSYIDKICRHFKTRIEEHIKKDKKSHICKHLRSTTTLFYSYNYLSFKIIDKAYSKFDLKIKEDLHINWRKSNLNAWQYHLSLTFSLQLAPSHSYLLSLFFLPFSFIYDFRQSLTVIISIFYPINYASLLLHLITNTFYHNFLIHLWFSLSLTLVIGIFYYLRYYFTSL